MARILWLNWSGGGNLPPSLGIARVLTERGHERRVCRAAGDGTARQAAGLRAIEITRAYEQVDRYPQGQLPDPHVLLPHIARRRGASAIDRRRRGAGYRARRRHVSGGAGASLRVRSPVGRVRPHLRVSPARDVAPDVHDARRHAPAGRFPGLPPLDDLWRPRERIISTSLGGVRRARPCLVGTWCVTPVRCSKTKNSPCPPCYPGKPPIRRRS